MKKADPGVFVFVVHYKDDSESGNEQEFYVIAGTLDEADKMSISLLKKWDEVLKGYHVSMIRRTDEISGASSEARMIIKKWPKKGR